MSSTPGCPNMDFTLSLEQRQKLHTLLEFYFDVKSVILYSEEVDAESQYNVQIWQETRSSFDHLMRALLGLETATKPESYVIQNFDKAYSHLYRACYDAAEGAIFSLKQRVIETISSYTPTQLLQVIPNHANDRIAMEHINEKLILYRSRKDIASAEESDFDAILDIIEQLKEMYDKYNKALPLLNDLAKEGKRNTVKSIVVGLMIALVGVVVGSFL
jgi:hypothetical protein